jgi:thioesterase domain-containing protein
MAARLVSHLQKATGKQIPLSLLFRGATPEYLARVLQDGVDLPPEPVAVPISQGDSGPIFFAAVPPGENALGYAKLARYMGTHQRFYKLQGRGGALVDRPYTDAEMQSLADEYVNAMCAVQPEGPYHFGGLCDGAHIALRMARRLEELGREVGTLAVFDTWVLENSQRLLPWYMHYYSQRLREFRKLPMGKKLQVGLRGFRNWVKKVLRPNRRRSLWSEVYWPDKDFVPPTFSGRVTLFKRPVQPYYYLDDPKMGWGARAAGGVDVQILPIRHAEMLQEPHVRILAQRLREYLRQRFQEQTVPVTRQDDDAELAISGGEATSGAS